MVNEPLPQWIKVLDKLLDEAKKEKSIKKPELVYFTPIEDKLRT